MDELHTRHIDTSNSPADLLMKVIPCGAKRRHLVQLFLHDSLIMTNISPTWGFRVSGGSPSKLNENYDAINTVQYTGTPKLGNPIKTRIRWHRGDCGQPIGI